MQMHSVDTKVGITIWFAASMIAGRSSRPLSRCASMFSIITVASSTRIPTASASPPRVMTLMVCPNQASARIEHRIESGIEVATINVERPEPRNNSTTRPVNTAAITISCTTSSTEARTKVEASFSAVIFTPAGNVCRIWGIFALTPATTASVDASPALSISSNTACCPRTSTELVCGGPPRYTWATSPTVTIAPPTFLIGSASNEATLTGDALVSTRKSIVPIFWSPAGSTMFCCARA